VVDDDLWAIVKSDWHDPHAVPGGRKNRVPRAPAR
jgi:hypothetical protein